MARPRKELEFVCVDCGYPEVHTEDGKTEFRRGPRTESEAEDRGWVQTEFGWLCSKCANAYRAGQEAAAAAGYDSQIGLESMAEALAAQIQEPQEIDLTPLLKKLEA